MNKNFLSFPLALPFFVLLLLLPFFLLAIVALLNISAAAIVDQVLGLSPVQALAIYLLILAGSVVNIPIYEFKSEGSRDPQIIPYMGVRYRLPAWHNKRTLLALNVGGCIVPALASAYFALSLPLLQLILCVVVVTLGVFYFSRPVRNVGVMVPAIVPPVLAVGIAFIALYLGHIQIHELARMAFASGVFGTIIGADMLHLGKVRKLGADIVSFGGAGTFEGIVLTGIVATVFAAILAGV